ncbi:hypothetical protein GCM10009007_03030 [Formosimonas limnophila]|uniref:Uncharacterized protein n=2 Tax=Formosimonas limnophila TaxID=1384487 RepID=A0A8J3G063_9BURK|nr:hypothetical protein GCM10009007_03030 [Formosimonas limnophila]
MGEYIQQLAKLLGDENHPTFKGIAKGSTILRTKIPEERMPYVAHRIKESISDEASRGWKAKTVLMDMLGKDGIKTANLLDTEGNVVLALSTTVDLEPPAIKVYQSGSIDGVVTGIVGADDTMHLHIRDYLDRDLKLLVRDENIARTLLTQFRNGHVRVYVHGTWVRADNGWHPEASKCTVDSFEVLDETPISDVFKRLNQIDGNGWAELENPIKFWEDIRGVEH